MNRRQRYLSCFILILLALISALLSICVLEKEKPENVAAFENRFCDLTTLSLEADGATLQGDSSKYTISWNQLEQTAIVRSGILPVQAEHSFLFNVTLGGTQNALKTDRWNHKIQMELTTFLNGVVAGTQVMEVPMESAKGRARIFAAQINGAADSYQVIFRLSPLQETASAGTFTIAFWEVHVK